jgi:hypothetical protein
MPLVQLQEEPGKILHPLLDSEQHLHLAPLIRLANENSSITLGAVLAAINSAFSEKTLKSLAAEECINFSVKHQYNLKAHTHIFCD